MMIYDNISQGTINFVTKPAGKMFQFISKHVANTAWADQRKPHP